MTSSVVGPRRSSKALPKAKLGLPKNGLNHCLVVCCLSDPLQLSKTWWNHYIWEVCSANQWDTLKTTGLATGTDQQKGPNSSPWQCLTAHHTTSASKVEWIGLLSFASSATFTRPLANWLPLLQASQQLFVGKTLPQPTGCRKCFPRVHCWRRGLWRLQGAGNACGSQGWNKLSSSPHHPPGFSRFHSSCRAGHE